MSVNAFTERLNYLGAGKNLKKNTLCFKVWLFFKGSKYKERRKSVLYKQAEIRCKIRFTNVKLSGNILNTTPKDYETYWRGGTLHAPLKTKEKEK